MNWGVVLANESGIFDGPNDTLLNLVSCFGGNVASIYEDF